MSDLIKIAVDAMGGDGSPKKIIFVMSVVMNDPIYNFLGRIITTHCIYCNFY